MVKYTLAMVEAMLFAILIVAYRTDDGKPWVLPSVRSVEKQIAEDVNLDHEYLPISGLRDYRDSGLKLLLGDNSSAIVANKVRYKLKMTK